MTEGRSNNYNRMRLFRRSLIALGVAASLPTVVFAAVGMFYFLRAERSQVERATLERSRTVMTLVDAALRSDLGALRVLSSSVYFESRDWREFYPRVIRVRDANPHWATIRLYDVDGGAEIFDLRRPFGAPQPMQLAGDRTVNRLRGTRAPLIGGVVTESAPLVYMYFPVLSEQQLKYVIAVGIRPQAFQDILMAQIGGDTIAAVVDSQGRYLARTLNFDRRVGQLATSYVRDAIGRGRQGYYRGTTYEGFKSYSAFYASPWTGWSTHVTVASSLIDTPTSWSFVIAGAGGLGSALLGGVLIVLVLRDMAERRRAEEALRQSQKMEAVGQLTGGIAHDFNNLLTAIIGNLDSIRRHAGADERLQRQADNALEAARRGAKLTSQLLAFSRSQGLQLAPVALENLLRGMSGLLKQSVGLAIEVTVSVAPDARIVLCDANQLELALLNLAVNARDAMPEGGRLEISTQRMALQSAIDPDLRHLPRRDYVEIRVVDTGCGMTEEVRARAIEPFFTTKPVGLGTGLGLSQVYGVTHECGGTMLIQSAPGQGTTVRLLLPPAILAHGESRAESEATSTPAVQHASGDREICVLVVDDDRQVRRFVAESLRSLGYKVSDIDSGAAALGLLADQQRHFDLLVADFAMPGMNGAELARRAKQQRPDLRVLMVSGYADTAVIDAELGEPHLLRKPFDLAELGAAVADVLEKHV